MSPRVARAALLAAVLAWAGAATAGLTPRYGGTLVVALPEAPTSLDPAHLRSLADRIAASALYDTLFRWTAERSVAPHLVLRHEQSADGLTHTFWLKPYLAFHDGGDLDARDVVASWTRLLSPRRPAAAAWLLHGIKGARAYAAGRRARVPGLQVLNRLAFRVRLEQPDPHFLERLAALPTAVLPAGIDQRRRALARQPLGSGPFRFAGFDAAGALRLAAWRAHPDGRPFLDEILLAPPGPGTVDLAVDRAARVIGPTTNVETAAWRTVVLEPGRRLDLGRREVRAALFSLIDRARLRDTFGRGRTCAPAGLLPCPRERAVVPVPSLGTSPARTRLRAAELPVRLVLLVRHDPEAHARLAAALAEALRQAGLRPELSPAAPLKFVSTTNLELQDLTVTTFDPYLPDPELRWEQFRARYGLQTAEQTAEMLAVLPLYGEATVLEGRAALQGLAIRPDGTVPFADLWLAPAWLAGSTPDAPAAAAPAPEVAHETDARPAEDAEPDAATVEPDAGDARAAETSTTGVEASGTVTPADETD